MKFMARFLLKSDVLIGTLGDRNQRNERSMEQGFLLPNG